MITIIDYGLGNIRAFINLYERLNICIKIARTPEDLNGASRIILPGVGAFDHAITLLEKSGLRGVLTDLVLREQIPVIGICVGMQILAESSDEGVLPGLGWIKGKVRKLHSPNAPISNAGGLKLPLPHMGWNNIACRPESKLFSGLDDGPQFYFLHSYYFECTDSDNSIASAHYGHDFTCAVNKNNIYGVQFHPEKSHHNGIKLLKNFAEM